MKSDSKKKVLVFPSWYPTPEKPVTGSFFREQALLMREDFDIKVIVGFPEHVFWGKALSFLLRRKKCAPRSLKVLTPPKAIVFRYQQYPSGFFDKKNMDMMLRYYGKQIEALIQRGWKPDVFHAHSTWMAGIIAVRLGLRYGIPVIITEHSNPFLLHLFSTYQQKLIRHALENAQCVAAVSQYQARNILMHNISCDPIVVGNLVDEEKFTLGDLSMNHQYPFHILTIAYLAEFKDMRTFFLSLKELMNRNMTDFHATIIGGKLWGNLPVGAYEELAADIGVEKHCTFVGFVEREEIVRYFHQADVFISSSISETFGVAVAEAMASGTPVIATDSGGVRETVNPDTGIMVNIRDYRAVADAITGIWEKRLSFSPEAIRNSVVEKFGREAFKNRIGMLYQEVAEQRLAGNEKRAEV